MNQREIALFLANDAQRVILLSCITQIRALQGQILMLKLLKFSVYRCPDADPRTTASAYQLSCSI